MGGWFPIKQTDAAAERPTSPVTRWLRWLKGLLGLGVIGLSLRYVVLQMSRALAAAPLHTLNLDVRFVLTAVGLMVICLALGAWSWRLILLALGYSLPLSTCACIHTTANLAKYIPGYAWQLLGKGYLTRREGMPTGVVACGVAVEMGCLLLTDTLVALLFMPQRAAIPYLGTLSAPLRLTFLGTAILLAGGLPLLLRRIAESKLAARLRWAAHVERLTPLWIALAVITLGWVLLSLSFACILRALYPMLSLSGWLLGIHAFSLAFLVSFLVIFVPAGLGVREGALILILGAQLPENVISVASVLSRPVLIVSEVLGLALAWAWFVLKRHKRSITQRK